MSVTVQQLIDALQKYPPTDTIEVTCTYGDTGSIEVSPPAGDLERSGEIVLDCDEITPEDLR